LRVVAWFFGPYRMGSLIARGGMGEVYRAHDTRHDREVAIKLLGSEFADDREYRERFRREAQAAARLREPHVVPIHAYGEIDGRLYLDMRLVEGKDLGEIIRERGQLAPADAVDVVGQIASALDAAHADGLVHRDVKPSNVIVTPDGFGYLVDFGIARLMRANPNLTATGEAVGTLHYMAPERFSTAPIDHRADVYSLACVLYQCLTGLLPFDPENPMAVMYAHVHHEPPRPGAHRPELARFDPIIARGMAKDPAARFASAGELARAAREATSAPASTMREPVPMPAPGPAHTRVQQHTPPPAHTRVQQHTPAPPHTRVQPHPPPPAARPPARRSRSRRWVLAGAVLALLALGVAGFLLFQKSQADKNQGADPTDEPTTSQAPRPAADLGIGTPISEPKCDGQYIVVVGSAVDRNRYVDDVEKFLRDYPGAHYLHALSTGCTSLRARFDDGTEIYAAYYGPFASQEEACARRDEVGRKSFVRALDNSSPPGQIVSCG
jgi:serine/threonine protein kinase